LDDDLELFYEGQAERGCNLVRRHTSHALVEVQIDDEGAGAVMEGAFGISKECWIARNKGGNNDRGEGERGRLKRSMLWTCCATPGKNGRTWQRSSGKP